MQVVFLRVLWYQRGVVCTRMYVWYVCLAAIALAVAKFNLVVMSRVGDKAPLKPSQSTPRSQETR